MPRGVRSCQKPRAETRHEGVDEDQWPSCRRGEGLELNGVGIIKDIDACQGEGRRGRCLIRQRKHAFIAPLVDGPGGQGGLAEGRANGVWPEPELPHPPEDFYRVSRRNSNRGDILGLDRMTPCNQRGGQRRFTLPLCAEQQRAFSLNGHGVTMQDEPSQKIQGNRQYGAEQRDADQLVRGRRVTPIENIACRGDPKHGDAVPSNVETGGFYPPTFAFSNRKRQRTLLEDFEGGMLTAAQRRCQFWQRQITNDLGTMRIVTKSDAHGVRACHRRRLCSQTPVRR